MGLRVRRIRSSSNKGLHHSDATIQKIRDANIRTWSSPELRRVQSERKKGHVAWNKGLHLSPETKNKISDSLKGLVTWCKGLRKETDPRVKAISEKMKAHFIPEESRKKMRIGCLGKPSGMKGHHHSSEVRKKLSDSLRGRVHPWSKGKHLSPETRRKMSINGHGKNAGSKSHLYIDGRSKISNQYRGEDWRTIRRLVVERDGYRCDFSNTGKCKGRLIVHHLAPYHDSHNNNPGNLITLCNYHHGIVEHDGGA